MSFTVINCGHVHATVCEARACVFPPPPPVVRPVYVPTRDWKDDAGTMSRKQHGYLVHQLGADDRWLRTQSKHKGGRLSMNEASRLIDEIKAGRLVPSSEPKDGIKMDVTDERIAMIEGLWSLMPDRGYFAVRAQEGDPLTFIRLSTPKSGNYKGMVKVQTQHSESYIVRATRHIESGRWSIYDTSIIDKLMLLVADQEGSAMRYAREIKRCCRCNTELTDHRSLHYGIGPECEKSWPWVIARIDLENEQVDA